MSSTGPKHAMLTRLAVVARAVGHAHRLELLEQLAQAERTVDDLAARAGLPFANASQHLQALRRAGLVTSRRDGRHVVYRLAGDDVVDLVEGLRRVAERHLAEIDAVVTTYFTERDALEPITQEELSARLGSGSATVLDVRPADEYAAGHLPGAINVPLSVLASRLGRLPRGREVVAYCRGPYCVMSFEAVAALRAKGFRARRLDTGYPQWRAAGLPLEIA